MIKSAKYDLYLCWLESEDDYYYMTSKEITNNLKDWKYCSYKFEDTLGFRGMITVNPLDGGFYSYFLPFDLGTTQYGTLHSCGNYTNVKGKARSPCNSLKDSPETWVKPSKDPILFRHGLYQMVVTKFDVQ